MLLTSEQAPLFTQTDVNVGSGVRLTYSPTSSPLQSPPWVRQREVRPQREGSAPLNHRLWTLFTPHRDGGLWAQGFGAVR